MPIVDLEFEAPLNVSCQIGDTAYYVDTAAAFTSNQTVNSGVLGGLEVSQNSVAPQFIGIIQDIQNDRNRPPYDPTDNPAPFITVDTALSSTLFNNHAAFIFFSKEASANNSHILGYFAEVKLENNSSKEIELFNIATDVFESSK